MIGNYELSIIPSFIFAADGALLLPTDNASIIHAVEAAKLPLVADIPATPEARCHCGACTLVRQMAAVLHFLYFRW